MIGGLFLLGVCFVLPIVACCACCACGFFAANQASKRGGPRSHLQMQTATVQTTSVPAQPQPVVQMAAGVTVVQQPVVAVAQQPAVAVVSQPVMVQQPVVAAAAVAVVP